MSSQCVGFQGPLASEMRAFVEESYRRYGKPKKERKKKR